MKCAISEALLSVSHICSHLRLASSSSSFFAIAFAHNSCCLCMPGQMRVEFHRCLFAFCAEGQRPLVKCLLCKKLRIISRADASGKKGNKDGHANEYRNRQKTCLVNLMKMSIYVQTSPPPIVLERSLILWFLNLHKLRLIRFLNKCK